MTTWPSRHKAALLLAAAALAAGAYYGYDRLAGPKVEVAAVARRDIVETVVVSGRVATPYRVDVGSQVVGTVQKVPVEQGQRVKAGEVLVVLESSEARALLAQAEATLANARSQLARNRQLHDKGFIVRSVLDDSLHAEEIASRGLDAARARLAYATIRAPVSGVLIARDVERGDVVQPGKILMVLSPEGETQIVLQVDERNLSKLRPGQKALASADAYPGQRFPAELFYVNPGVDAQRGTVEVRLRVPQAPEYVRQDMTVSVDIETERRQAVLTLPAEAVHDSTGPAPWVLAVRDGRAVRLPVRLGLRGEGAVEILEGLAEGDAAVPVAQAKIRAGARLRPVRVNGAA